MFQDPSPFPLENVGNPSRGFCGLADGSRVVVRDGMLAGAAGLLVSCDEVGRCVVRLFGTGTGVYLAISQEFLARI